MSRSTGITKKQLKQYLYDKWDVSFDQLIKELQISKSDLRTIRTFLEQLEAEGWVVKGRYAGSYEYSPGDKQYELFNLEALHRSTRSVKGEKGERPLALTFSQ